MTAEVHMNILKTKIGFNFNDFLVSKMEQYVIKSKLNHLEKHQEDIFKLVAKALTTVKNGGVTRYSKCLVNLITKNYTIERFNIISMDDLRLALYENHDITSKLTYFQKRANCSIDIARYYYFEGAIPFLQWLAAKLEVYGKVSAKECYEKLWDIRRQAEEKMFQHN